MSNNGKSKQLAKLLNGKISTLHKGAHREGIDRVVARDRHCMNAIAQNDVFALTFNNEADFCSARIACWC